MNSKKKLTVLAFMLIFFLMQNVSLAQNSFDYSSGNFNVNLSPINPKQAPQAYYTLFIETGSGRYIRSGNIWDAKNITTQHFPYSSRINNGSRALVTISSYYDTTPRPPRDIAFSAYNPNATDPPPQDSLHFTASKPVRIGIDPCVNVIVPGDTMAVALVYKPTVSAGTNNLVAFFYNKISEGGNIFSPINGLTRYSFTGADPTYAIRIHNHETVYTSIPEGLPEAVRTKLSTAGSAYYNALYFFIDPNADESEKNIFFSLAPTNNSLSYIGSTSDFSATIINYNSSGSTQQNANTPLTIRSLARDPNWIKTTPHCFVGSEGIVDPHNIPINNQVKFTNDGSSDARDVIVTVTVPEGIKISLQLTGAYVYVNGTFRVFKPWSPTEQISYRISGRKIIFTMKRIGLRGTRHGGTEANREALITFKLITNPAPAVIPDCMVTKASIVFFNIGSENKPITAWDLVRSNCSVSCISKVKLDDTQ